MDRVFNFSAGPAMLPLEVLKQASEQLVSYGDCGMSVMEMSHRSFVYQCIIDRAEEVLREIMEIPVNYKVLFLQGGASLQFAMVPLNLFRNSRKADYVNTGMWSKKAIAEAKRYGNVNIVASSEDTTFNYIPNLDSSKFSMDADYFHITSNNTIYGTRYTVLPETGDVPLVADMSSNILAERYDVSKFGVIYAGAQKNLGPAGLTVVVVRDDLVGHAMDITPTMLNYKTHVETGSMFNTPPTYSIYIAKLVFEWVKDKGGVEVVEKINLEKASLIYNFLDNSRLFKGTVVPKDRSLVNIPFVLPREELNAKFIKTAKENGLVNLEGHRSVGGMRASIYNAMPIDGVKKLVSVMKKFELGN